MGGSFGSVSLGNPAEFLGILPVILLLIWGMVVEAVDLIGGRKVTRRALGITSALGLVGILIVAVLTRPVDPQVILGGMIRNDLFTFVFSVIFIVAGALTCLITIDF